MKLIDYYWDHPSLQQYRKHLPQGEYLFKEGEDAVSMYIILQGIVELQATFEGKMTTIGLVESGQFLGEKTILITDQPYKRAFSGRAKTEIRVVGLKWFDLLSIQKKDPGIVTDILTHMFHIAAERLDRSNQLMRILRLSNNVERIVRFIHYFAHHNGMPGPQGGLEFYLPAASLRYYIDADPKQIKDCLEELLVHQILKRSGPPDSYCLPDDKKLLEFIRPLSKFMEAGFYESLEAIP